jgi:putative ABC transport system ATP-binding protein
MWINGRRCLKALGGINMRILEAHDIYRFFHTGEEETLALKGVSIHVELGEMVAVMGPSGSGKSTLFSCLTGLDEPDGGYVELGGKRLTRRSEAERAAMRAADIGILLQSGNLFQHLTVEGNIYLQMQLAQKMDKKMVDQVLQLVGLQERRKAFPSQLSGGEAARAGLAVALSTSPKVLLADEPTGEVDAETEERIINLLEHRRTNGGATLISTHSLSLTARADRLVRLHDGRILNE